MAKKISSILADLEQFNNESIVEIQLPSNQQIKKFKPISVYQQKNIIGKLSSNPIDNVVLINSLNSIITDNCTDDASEISTFDRELILLVLKDNDEAKEQVAAVVAKLKEIDASYLLTDELNFEGKLIIEIAIPSLERDSEFNAAFIDEYKANNAAPNVIASNYFVHELVKHIKVIRMQNDAEVFDKVEDLAAYAKIVEKLPAKINNKIAKFIAQSKQVIEKLFVEYNLTTQTPLF